MLLVAAPPRDGIPELLVEDAKEPGRTNLAEGEGGAALPEVVDDSARGVEPERGAEPGKGEGSGGTGGNGGGGENGSWARAGDE